MGLWVWPTFNPGQHHRWTTSIGSFSIDNLVHLDYFLMGLANLIHKLNYLDETQNFNTYTMYSLEDITLARVIDLVSQIPQRVLMYSYAWSI